MKYYTMQIMAFEITAGSTIPQYFMFYAFQQRPKRMGPLEKCDKKETRQKIRQTLIHSANLLKAGRKRNKKMYEHQTMEIFIPTPTITHWSL